MKSIKTNDEMPKMKIGLPVLFVLSGFITTSGLIFWLNHASNSEPLTLSFIFATLIILMLLLFGFGAYGLFLANEIQKEEIRGWKRRIEKECDLEMLKAQMGTEEVQKKKLGIEELRILYGIKKEILIKWIEVPDRKPPQTKEMKKIWDELGKALDEYIKELFKKRG